jgi:alkylation response protein AidB-like acyl-CoA dehydrogenase
MTQANADRANETGSYVARPATEEFGRSQHSGAAQGSVFAFNSTPGELDFRAAVRTFARAEILPIAAECDRAGAAPLAVVERFWQRGLAAHALPDAHGQPTPYLRLSCIAAEELAYACPAIASLIMLPVFLIRLVLLHLVEPQRSEFRARVLAQPVIVAFAASERLAGSDLLLQETRAEPSAEGYVLNGRKEYSSNLRQASHVIVVARTTASQERSRDALTWFLVPTNLVGVTVGERWPTLGLRAMDLSPLELRDVRIPYDHRLGGQGRGWQLMTESLAQSRTGIASIALGIARRARDEVIAFSTKRVLYGEKLYKMQDYRFRIAEMEQDIAAARALCHVSAQQHDAGIDHLKEASIAKLYAGQMVMRVTESACLMLGSLGYTGQTVSEKLFRDARHVAIVEGTDPTHKEIIFASVLRGGAY